MGSSKQASGQVIRPTLLSVQGELELVKGIGQGEYCSRQCITYLCRYLIEVCDQKALRVLVMPYLQDILIRVMLPLCFFTDRLNEQWHEDPMEVIRKNSTALISYDADDMYDVRDSAASVVVEIMKIKVLRDKFLEPFMKEVVALAQAFRIQHGALRFPTYYKLYNKVFM
jgi:hypothetical protein